ncbi:MAG: hypothetical protein A2W07_09300 [candidate division Zixibacteria bacterium RBG_16_43_9]|nr:MAG: hypothetical protein A2W07_09300 [candidate division Zixibacteria bacterium RBG_16_43_9]
MDVSAKITGIKYLPFLCRKLNTYSINNLNEALSKDGTFIVTIDEKKQLALSWWVSAKRTRSYPYARVYDSLSFQGKKVTLIPLFKDEGKEGDRDFLQWDTVSLMSLLNVYAIISYYSDAEQSSRYKHKITNQRFDMIPLKEEIYNLLPYQSDALDWNLTQIEKVGEIGQKALNSYAKISKKLDVDMHSEKSAKKRIEELLKGKENFMNLSRGLAKKAQSRESITVQPKEKLTGNKATLTIKNNLGGHYFFTCDEVIINKENIYLIEGKHSEQSSIPSLEDIKDGLLKMILFTNLKEVKIRDKEFSPFAILKLTSNEKFSKESLRKSQVEQLRLLKKEAEENQFQVSINDKNLKDIGL